MTVDFTGRVGDDAPMLRAFSLSLAQLLDPPVLRVLAKSLALTLLLFAALWFALGYGAYAFATGYALDQRLGIAAGLAATLAGISAAWLLFRVVAVAILNLFGDEIVAAVERRHYPQAAARARDISFVASANMGLRSAGRALLFNLLAAPFYLLLLVTGIGTLALFTAVNALLLGRDLGEMVAVRHVHALKPWLARTRLQRAFLGLVVTILFLIPFANLLAPIIGAAMATHLFHQEPA